jgi:molybdate transport system substrate-binding protein
VDTPTRLIVAALACVLTSCRAPADANSVHVFAASSLTDVFGDLEREFESANPGIDVVVSFAGSDVLRRQIEEGAPAELFYSADEHHVRALEEAGLVDEVDVFARNALVVVVRADDADAIRSFDTLPRAQRIVVGAEDVPIGRYTDELLDAVDPELAKTVRANIVSREPNVRLVRTKVELGEADAAIVYRSDAVSAPALRSIPVPDAVQVEVSHHVGRIKGAGSSAESFLRFSLSEGAAEHFARHGFTAPGGS